MAASNYLTTELKKYYLLDFEQVLLINDPFWGIPEAFLKACLVAINKSNSIQTLYSRIKKENDTEDEESYLVIGFSKDVEQSLQQALEEFPLSFKSTVSIDLMPPSENLNTGSKEFKSGAIHNKDYFNIYHFRITCISTNYKDHEDFWTKITALLVNF